MLKKPEPTEYPEYYKRYINEVPENEIIDYLESQIDELEEIVNGLTDEEALYRYEENKWSIKEVIGHITDADRILGLRALRIARNDKTDMPSYDHDKYVVEANFDEQTLEDLSDQFKLARMNNVFIFDSLTDEMWTRTGTASGSNFTASAFPYILAGHVKHHLDFLKEKYLTK